MLAFSSSIFSTIRKIWLLPEDPPIYQKRLIVLLVTKGLAGQFEGQLASRGAAITIGQNKILTNTMPTANTTDVFIIYLLLPELKKNQEPLHSFKHTSAEGDSTPVTGLVG